MNSAWTVAALLAETRKKEKKKKKKNKQKKRRHDQRYSRNHCKAHKGKRKTNGMNNSSTLPFPNENFIHYI